MSFKIKNIELSSIVASQIENREISKKTKGTVNEYLEKKISEWKKKELNVIEEIGKLCARGVKNTQKINHKIIEIEKNKNSIQSFFGAGVLTQIFTSIYSSCSGLNSLKKTLNKYQDFSSIFSNIKVEHEKNREEEKILLRNVENIRNDPLKTEDLNKFLNQPGFAISAKNVIKELSALEGKSIETFKKGFEIWSKFSEQWLPMSGKGLDDAALLIEASYLEGKDNLFAWKKTVEELNDWRDSNKDSIDFKLRTEVNKLKDADLKEKTKEIHNKVEGEYVRKFKSINENEFDKLTDNEKIKLVKETKNEMSKKEIKNMAHDVEQSERQSIINGVDGIFSFFSSLEIMLGKFSEAPPDQFPLEPTQDTNASI
ncbi:MAG: hypothetical protein H0T62_04220 [Parachlamydiaceae bacterium]|nr:hypothetical protein [Parachlamydiaceae bacterium]